MDPRLQLYNDIKGVVESRLPEIAHYGLWNENMDYASEEIPFSRPALFVEFGDIEWGTYLKGVDGVSSVGKGSVRLHLITDWQDDVDYVEPFVLCERLNEMMGYCHASTRYGLLYPASTHTDHNHASLLCSTEEYGVKFYRNIKKREEGDDC